LLEEFLAALAENSPAGNVVPFEGLPQISQPFFAFSKQAWLLQLSQPCVSRLSTLSISGSGRPTTPPPRGPANQNP
jgi:hypothetical protein